MSRTAPSTATAAGLVDWPLALRLAAAGTPSGPRTTPARRRALVDLLHRSAEEALPWAAEITGVSPAQARAAQAAEILVVDRTGAQRVQAAALRSLLGRVPAPATGPASRKTAAVELAAGFGAVSAQMLGQVLPVHAPRGAAGAPASPRGAAPARLVLIAPSIMATRTRLDLDVLDLPAWVALHEAAHVLQAVRAPWLLEHLQERMAGLLATVVDALSTTSPSGRRVWDPASGRAALRTAVRALTAAPVQRGGLAPVTARAPRGAATLRAADVIGADGRRRLAELAAELSFLEGQAETVLDAVQPSRMPSVHRLRAVLAPGRSDGVGPGPGAGSLLGRLAGIDGKAAQYADGSAFARAVAARGGQESLAAAWRGPEMLPSPEELASPEAWLERTGA